MAKKRPDQPEGFYDTALGTAEQELVKAARHVSGLDQEIAILRIKLRAALVENPDQLLAITQLIELLIKAVAARNKLAQDQEATMLQALGDVLGSVTGVLGPSLATLLGKPH